MSPSKEASMYILMSLEKYDGNVTSDVPKTNSKIDPNLMKNDFEKIYSPLKGNN